MKLKGTVHKFTNNINTDEIMPARYLNTSDPDELAKHCMEDANSRFAKKVQEGDIIVAGENFGCGSSREHAPIAIKAAGVSCVIAKSFARIFYRNAINIGLLIFTSPEAAIALKNGDRAEVDVNKGEITKLGRKKVYKAEVFPKFIKEIIRSGGLMEYAKEEVKPAKRIKTAKKAKPVKKKPAKRKSAKKAAVKKKKLQKKKTSGKKKKKK
jgi:3-isopropylmalate/(R)-2-methylmalate dehydratase small subunit